MLPGLSEEDPSICAQVAIEALYAPYLQRQASEIAQLRRGDDTHIEPDFDYSRVIGLSTELRVKLQVAQPATLERAGRIEGMTPAALMLVLAHVRKAQKQKAAS